MLPAWPGAGFLPAAVAGPRAVKRFSSRVGALYRGLWERVRGGGAAGSGSGTSPAKPEMRAIAAVGRLVR